MVHGKEKEISIFKALASKSTYKVGCDFGLDKIYKNARGVRNAVNSIYAKVKNNQDKYGISDDTLDLVEQGMKERRLAGHPANHPITHAEEKELAVKDIKEVVIDIRNRSFDLIDKKLSRVANSKKKLDAMSFKDLGIIAGISFDKAQILKGEATENIAVMAKIDHNITADEALKIALETRDGNVEKNMN